MLKKFIFELIKKVYSLAKHILCYFVINFIIPNDVMSDPYYPDFKKFESTEYPNYEQIATNEFDELIFRMMNENFREHERKITKSINLITSLEDKNIYTFGDNYL